MRSATIAPMTESPSATPASRSDVTIVGRLGSRVEERTLPSGDVITTFTVVVDRRRRRGDAPTAAKVDAIPCQATQSAVARRLATVESGQWIRVEGHLRRRFWRSAGGLGSAMEVEVSRLTAHR